MTSGPVAEGPASIPGSYPLRYGPGLDASTKEAGFTRLSASREASCGAPDRGGKRPEASRSRGVEEGIACGADGQCTLRVTNEAKAT